MLREHGITPHNLPGCLARAEHHEALPIDAVPDFMVWLHNEGMGARALEFAILTASRSRGTLLRHARRAGHGSVTQTKRPPANPGRFSHHFKRWQLFAISFDRLRQSSYVHFAQCRNARGAPALKGFTDVAGIIGTASP